MRNHKDYNVICVFATFKYMYTQSVLLHQCLNYQFSVIIYNQS